MSNVPRADPCIRVSMSSCIAITAPAPKPLVTLTVVSSTPTLKARWYDDESIAALGVVVEGDVEGDVEGVGSAADLQGVRQNTLKAGPSDVPHVAVSTQAPVYRPASTGEPPTG